MRREKKKCGPINLYNKHTYKQKRPYTISNVCLWRDFTKFSVIFGPWKYHSSQNCWSTEGECIYM